MQIDERHSGETLVLKVMEPRLDANVAAGFKDAMTGYIEAGHRHIVLNLAATEFIDSSGLGAIVSALKQVGPDGEIVICELGDAARSLFKLTRMDKVFTIHATEADALAG